MNKIYKLGILVISVLVLNACGSDDDSNGGSTGIVGTWKITSLTVESDKDYNQDGNANPNLLEETQCSLNDLFVFNADGTGEIISDGFNISLDVDQDVNFDYFYTFDCIDFSSYTLDSTWTQDGNTITVLSVGGSVVFTLDGSELVSVEENVFQVPEISSDGFGWDFVIEDSVTTLTKI